MAALGDKIGSTILAQAANVPTIPWSGSGISMDYGTCDGVIPQDIYDAVGGTTLSSNFQVGRKAQIYWRRSLAVMNVTNKTAASLEMRTQTV